MQQFVDADAENLLLCLSLPQGKGNMSEDTAHVQSWGDKIT